MAYKAKIDNVVYDLKDGFTIKDELNETLDSSIVQFNTYNGEVSFECFDVAQIYDDEDKITPKYFLVDTIDDEVRSFGVNFNSDDHLYTVNLFSETKELERITLPNCSVTQPMLEGLHKKTVWEEIERFCSLYVPRIKVYDSESSNNYSYQRKFTLDPLLRTRFQNIVCPEFQWNNPTLREVLNDLVSTDDCIIVAKRGIISFYDLKEKGNPIDTTKLSLSKRTMTSQDYVGELTIDMQNAIGKSSAIICNGVSLRAPENTASLNTSNGIIGTMNDIYAIKKLIVRCPVTKRVDDSIKYYELLLDITDRVLEEEEFNLLSNVKVNGSAYNNLPSYTDANGATLKKHKANYLYYKRGSRNIFNIGTQYSELVGNTYFAWNALTEIARARHLISDPYELGSDISSRIDPREITFHLEYETVTEHSMKAGKYLPVKHHDNRVFDNQANSYVDVEHQSIFEYSKINRLGHRVRTIYGEYQTEDEVPQLGDYIGEEILFSREVTYFDNIIMFKGFLTPHYVLKDFYTGVRAKKRSWQIAKNADALTRHDVYKLYYEASFSLKTDVFNYDDADGIKLVEHNISRNLLAFESNSYKSSNISNAVVRTKDNSNAYYPEQYYGIMVDAEPSSQNMSLCINFGFFDNYKSSDYIVVDGSETIQSFYAYANNNGEYEEEYALLIGKGDNYDHAGYIYESSLSEINSHKTLSYQKPKVSYSTDFYSRHGFVFNVKKDNREIIKHTLQFEYCSDTKDIIIYPKLIEMCEWVIKTDTMLYNGYKVYSSNERYNDNDKTPKGNVLSNVSIKTTSTNQSINVCISRGSTAIVIDENTKSWCITDSNDNILLAVNVQEGKNTMECYFNLLRSRDDKIYSDNYNGVAVGDITPNGIANASINVSTYNNSSNQVRVLRRTINHNDTI